MELGPFRYITRVTSVDGFPPFVVKERQMINGTVIWKGSPNIEGILEIAVGAKVKVRKDDDRADMRDDEDGIWDEPDSFVKPISPCPLSQLVLWLIRTCRTVLTVVYGKLTRFSRREWRSLSSKDRAVLPSTGQFFSWVVSKASFLVERIQRTLLVTQTIARDFIYKLGDFQTSDADLYPPL